MHTNRFRRARRLSIGVVLAGVAGLGVAVALPANAATDTDPAQSGTVGTWTLTITVTPDNTRMGAIKTVFLRSTREPSEACHRISPGDTKTFNVTGVLGSPVQVMSYAEEEAKEAGKAAECRDDQKLPHLPSTVADFTSPKHPEGNVTVTFYLGSTSVE